MSNIKHKRPSKSIKDLLKALGISICQFGYDHDFDVSVASRIANGWLIPFDPTRRARIAEYLGVPESAIFPKTSATEPLPRPQNCETPCLEG